jgi:3-hydroxybutyryl-CoA dehydrogenase
MRDIKNISVIGAGLMGHGIAQVFAGQGYRVMLMDSVAEALPRALENIRSNLAMMARKGTGSEHDIGTVLERIQTGTDLKKAVEGAHFVVEAVKEDSALKQGLFAELDSYCPEETILATNTSVISITEIARKAKRKERVIGTHFWNPPYLIPLVEVVRTKETSDHVIETTIGLLKSAGKHPVRVNRDVPGFVANRLQHALWREAISIVERGIADAATVDECVRFGPGMRLPILGPLENADMVGLDLVLAIHRYILKHLEDSHEPSPLLKKLASNGNLGFKTGKGFQEWTGEQINESRARLREYLIGVIKDKQPA